MVYYEKTDFEAQKKIFVPKYIMARLYFIQSWSNLCWNFLSWPRDASDIYRFPAQHMVKTHFLLENRWISEPSLGTMGKVQCRSDAPCVKYNCDNHPKLKYLHGRSTNLAILTFFWTSRSSDLWPTFSCRKIVYSKYIAITWEMLFCVRVFKLLLSKVSFRTTTRVKGLFHIGLFNLSSSFFSFSRRILKLYK